MSFIKSDYNNIFIDFTKEIKKKKVGIKDYICLKLIWNYTLRVSIKMVRIYSINFKKKNHHIFQIYI